MSFFNIFMVTNLVSVPPTPLTAWSHIMIMAHQDCFRKAYHETVLLIVSLQL